jgi:hypothetical protein
MCASLKIRKIAPARRDHATRRADYPLLDRQHTE